MDKTCSLATHSTGQHKDQMVGAGKLFDSGDIKRLLTFTLLESVGLDGSFESLERREEQWRNQLHSWFPIGLTSEKMAPSYWEIRELKWTKISLLLFKLVNLIV